jgi:hypothetical protein
MPGELAKMQKRGQGAKGEVPLGGQLQKLVLPIFRSPIFIGHGALNPYFVPGLARGGFPGEDEYGWGTHPNGLVDCINLQACTNGFSLMAEQNWPTLWDYERRDDHEPVVQFLERLIIPIRLDPSSVKRIPNPETWNVEVQLDSGLLKPGALGKLTLKARPTEGTEAVHSTFYSARKIFPDFTKGSQPWVTNK